MKKLIIIAFVSILLAVISFVMSPSYNKKTIIGELVFPQLQDKINELDKITIKSKYGDVNIVRDDNGVFVVEELSGFKAKEDRVKRILLGVSRLEYFEKKTSDKDKYKDLKVEEVSEESGSYLLEVFEKNKEQPYSIILGASKLGISGFSNGIFIRKPDEEQVWLARSSFDVTGIPLQFVDNSIANIPVDEINSVTIRQHGLLYKIEDKENGIFKFFENLDFYMAERDNDSKEVIASYDFVLKGGLSITVDKIKQEVGNPLIRIVPKKSKAMTVPAYELYNGLKNCEGWLFKIDAFKLNYLLEMKKNDKKS